MKQYLSKQKSFPVSIIICTHNGEKTLVSCLESLNKLIYPSDKLEILIVNNASTDKTKKISQDFIKKSKFKSRYILESELGLSTARNRGVKEAKNEIIAFIDDDAEADRNWIKNINICFQDKNVRAVGGRVKPKFEIKPPKWLPSKYLFALTILDLGLKIKEVPYICGTNMAFRKKVFSQTGFFRTDLGRKGSNLLSGEELDLCQRITKADGKIIYNPKALVYHLASKERLTKKFFRKRIFIEGVSLAKMDKKRVDFRKRLGWTVFHRPKGLLIALFWLLIFSFQRDEKKSFSYQCDFLLNLGYLYEVFRGWWPVDRNPFLF